MTTKYVKVSKNNLGEIAETLASKPIKSLKESIGLRLERAFVDRIQDGDPSWAPLSPAWADKKGHGEQWYYTGHLENAIEYDIDGSEVHVGIFEHDTYPEGETIATVAAALEYGTSNIPMRPLFRPVFDEQIEGIVKDATEDIGKRMKKAAL